MSNDFVGFVVWMAFVFGCAFLFDGDPDVWDRLHAAAMGVCK